MGLQRFLCFCLALMPAVSAVGGVKTRWTVEVYNLDHHSAPAPENRLYSKPFTLSILENGAHVGMGGAYNALYPLGEPTKPTGDFQFKIQWAKNEIEAEYRLSVWDRTDAPPQGYNAIIESEGRMQPGETQKIYFTQGPFAQGKASRYQLFIHLDSVATCRDESTCWDE